MKLKIVLICVFFFSTATYAQNDKSCEAAVDAAASMNMNQPECDYSDKGLNGFLQKAFKNGEEGATLDTGDNKGAVNKNNNDSEQTLQKNKQEKTKQENSNEKNFLLNVQLVDWADASVVRTQLLSKAMEKCGAGFTITEETYRSLLGEKLELSMRFECVNG